MNIDIRDAFFGKLYNIGSKDKNVIVMTADADAFGLRKFKKDFPDQFINVGVAEQNMVTVATGLALSGKKVFIYAIIPFIVMRCFEHIKANICSLNLPVTIIGAGAGLSFSYDGPTHHAVQDIAIMRTLPEMTIYNPCDHVMAKALVEVAYESESPVYIRLDKGKLPALYKDDHSILCQQSAAMLRNGFHYCIVSTGYMVHKAMEVASYFKKDFVEIAILDLFKLKPINNDFIGKILSGFDWVICVEENYGTGGISTIITEVIINSGINIKFKQISIKDEQCFQYGSRDWLHEYYRIDVHNIICQIYRLE